MGERVVKSRTPIKPVRLLEAAGLCLVLVILAVLLCVQVFRFVEGTADSTILATVAVGGILAVLHALVAIWFRVRFGSDWAKAALLFPEGVIAWQRYVRSVNPAGLCRRVGLIPIFPAEWLAVALAALVLVVRLMRF